MFGIMNSVIQTAARTDTHASDTPAVPTDDRAKRSLRAPRTPSPRIRDAKPHELHLGRGYW